MEDISVYTRSTSFGLHFSEPYVYDDVFMTSQTDFIYM